MQFATDFADPSNGHVPMECGLRGIGPRSRIHPVAPRSVFEFIKSKYAQPTQGKKRVSTEQNELGISRIMQTEIFHVGKKYIDVQSLRPQTYIKPIAS